MKSRRLIGMVISALLIVLLLLVFTDPWSTFRNEGDNIVLKDRDGIDRIVLSDAFDSTLLTRENDTWLLFGRESANPVTVENLLFAAERLQINSIVSKDSVYVDQQGRKIQFFEGEKLVLEYEFLNLGKQYLVCPAGSNQAFFVSIAGYGNRNLEKVFSTAVNHYREHLLIDLVPSEVSLVEIELAGGEAFRFTQDKEGAISCLPSNEETTLPPGAMDELSIRLLFSYFTSIRYEQTAGIQAESITANNGTSKRIARLHVESHNLEKHTLQIYPYYEKAGAEPHMFRALVIHNNDPEVLLVNYIYLDVLMRDLAHYFGEK